MQRSDSKQSTLKFLYGEKIHCHCRFFSYSIIKTWHTNIVFFLRETLEKDMPNVVHWRSASLANLVIQWPIELVSLWLCGLVFCFVINLKALNKCVWLIESFKQVKQRQKKEQRVICTFIFEAVQMTFKITIKEQLNYSVHNLAVWSILFSVGLGIK